MAEPSSIRKGADSIAFQSIEPMHLQDHRKIGSGGFGIVYKAKHQILGDVAVKECRLNSETEVDGLAKPGANNFIVRIFGWIKPTKTDFNSYIVMEYMEYGSLKEFSRKLMPFPDSLKIKMISEVIKGMYFLHNKDIIHRDLKLDNIFVGREFSVKIGDLGLAVWKSVADHSKSKATPGTMSHMAPEILDTINEPATTMSDVYSFGITLWELSTLKDPYEHAQNLGHLKMCVCNGQRPDMKDFPKDVPHIIKDMMERAWHPTPAKRPTFQVLKEEIEKEYAANYEKDFFTDRAKIYAQPFLVQRNEEELCKQTCTPPWCMARDIPDSSRLQDDDVFMHEGSKPSPLQSRDHQRNGSIPEKKSVTVSDTGKGEFTGVSTAMANLGLNEVRQPVQPVSGARQPVQSVSGPTEESLAPQSTMGGKAVQPESGGTEGSWHPPQSSLAPHPTRTPTQESEHKNPETSKPSSFHNQPQNQQQTGQYPQQNHPFMPQNPWSQGSYFNISGVGHTFIVANPGSTVTMPEPKKEEKGEKWTGRRDNSSASKGGRRQEGPPSSDSESDVLDPKVLETMESKEILKEKHLTNLSRHIGRNWRDLGRELGLKNGKLDNIEYDNHGDQREMAFQVMLAWMRKKGRATKGELATALVDVGLSEVALKIK